MTEWRSTTLGQLCATGEASIQTGPFGSQLHAHEYADQGIGVVPTEAIAARRLEAAKLVKVPDDVANRLRRHTLKAGDIVFARRGVQATGHSALVTQAFAGSLCGTGVIRLRLASDGIDATYLSFFLTSPPTFEWIRTNAVGAVMPSLNKEILQRLPIVLPPLVEQHSIAYLLGALDDKIELNREMNRTMEDTAQALFRSWFVDFDPVVAKADGRKPFGMSNEMAALFPTHFEETELASIPSGWRWKPISEAFNVNPKGPLIKGEEAPYLSMQDAPTHSAIPECWGTRAFGSGTTFQNGDTLIAKITPCLENGKGAFIVDLEPGQVGWGSTEFIVLRSRAPLTPEHAYFLSRLDDFRAHLVANMSGSSGRQRVSMGALDHFHCCVAPPPVHAAFGLLTTPLMTAIAAGTAESRTLADLRDLLLPKLLSGEIRVRQAEQQVEAVL